MGKKLLKHSDKYLYLASSVSITFEEQKRGTKNDTITHHRTNNTLLCPVKIWSKIIKRIISYPSTNQDTTVNSFLLENNSIYKFSGKNLLTHLWRAADSLGPEKLGYTSDQIGLHSARSGVAMAMYLAGVPMFTIMLLGRWSSDAFLRYIRKEVQEFSNSISSKMIQSEKFFTLADPIVSSEGNGSRNNHGTNFKDALKPLVSTFKAIQVS
jgi:hypothetical protein